MPLMTRRLFEAAKRAIVASLSAMDGVSLTMDGWTDKSNRKYTGDTVCAINADFEVKNFTIGLIPCNSPTQTTDVIVDDVSACYEAFLPANALVAAITSDNGANFKSARSRIVGVANGLHCFIHGIQLCVRAAIDCNDDHFSIRQDIEAIRTFVKRVRNNSTLRQRLASVYGFAAAARLS